MQSQYASLLWLVAFFAIMYFMLIRPQQQRQKKLQETINNLRVGDRIITIGGIHGTIDVIKDDSFIVKVADKVLIEFQKNAVSQLMDDDTE